MMKMHCSHGHHDDSLGRALAELARDVPRRRAAPELHARRGGALRHAARYLRPKVVGAFVAKRAAVVLAYVDDNTLAVEEALLGNELDLGCVGGHLATGELETEPLVKDEVVVYAAASHPLARKRRLDAKRL